MRLQQRPATTRKLFGVPVLGVGLILLRALCAMPPVHAQMSHQTVGWPSTVSTPERNSNVAPELRGLRPDELDTRELAVDHPPAFRHIRPVEPAAQGLLALGAERSRTISRLIDAIEQSDLVVYLHVSFPPGALRTCQTRLNGGIPQEWRFVSVWIDQNLVMPRRIAMLGHELQHVVEIAGARDVYDEAGIEQLYERIGYRSWESRGYETRAAANVERQVSRDCLDRRLEEQIAAESARLTRRQLYDAYCAVCHGRDGKGGGPTVPALGTRPSDLTVLARRQGGAFPWAQVERCIRAMDRLLSVTGPGGTPVWGPTLESETDPGAALRVRDITAYVESLQRK
jgi:mono/diheme cytochrome c family protein